jgi:hypothetical protein
VKLYGELIREMRDRNSSFRDIAWALAEKRTFWQGLRAPIKTMDAESLRALAPTPSSIAARRLW